MHSKFFKKNILRAFLLFAIACLLSFPATIIFSSELAEMKCEAPDFGFTLQTDWPASPLGGYTLSEDSALADLVGYFFGWGVGLGGLAVFIALIIAGIQYITSVADPNKLSEARKRIQSAAIGLALLLSSWAIFSLINPNLTEMAVALPTIPANLAGNFPINNRSCSGPNDNINCCKDSDGTFDQQCVPKNWRCCRGNDSVCAETGNEAKITPGASDNYQFCSKNADCQSLYCGCNYGFDENGSKTDWQKICLPNPYTCIATYNAPETGCDVVIFYDEVNFAGNEYKVEGAGNNAINGGWINFPQGPVSQPKSYQAFSYKKNADGTVDIAKLEPCGFLACGCLINRCLNRDSGKCIKETADENTGEFKEYAYSATNFENITAVRIKDKTKQGTLVNIANQTQNVIGTFIGIIGGMFR